MSYPRLTPVEPGYRAVLHAKAALPSILLATGGIAAGVAARTALDLPGWPIALVVAGIAIWSLIVAPRRHWAAWGWALEDGELHVAHGVWTQVHTIVPLDRVQHIDVAQGPLERTFGVARLVLHTAGTAHATVTLPGISRSTAESLRDTIRAHVRTEPW